MAYAFQWSQMQNDAKKEYPSIEFAVVVVSSQSSQSDAYSFAHTFQWRHHIMSFLISYFGNNQFRELINSVKQAKIQK